MERDICIFFVILACIFAACEKEENDNITIFSSKFHYDIFQDAFRLVVENAIEGKNARFKES
jgi:hypothetical protein